MKSYTYRPIRFYVTSFAATWAFWIAASFIKHDISMLFMMLGLMSPAVIAIITVETSKSAELKQDFKRKLINFCRLKPLNILVAIIAFAGIVTLSILLSVPLAGQSLEQFSFTDGFSFSIGGVSALVPILLASVIEEIGWRGYGEDAIASYCSWFKESIIFGIVWAMWHIPLFFIEGTYQHGLYVIGQEKGLGFLFVVNFLISVIPLGFLTTWVYVKNNRSMLACIIFHLFINTMQEKIAMTPETKCVETIAVTLAAVIVILVNRKMFFEKDHVGRLLEYNCEQ